MYHVNNVYRLITLYYDDDDSVFYDTKIHILFVSEIEYLWKG